MVTALESCTNTARDAEREMFGGVLATALFVGADRRTESAGAVQPHPAPEAARLVLEGVEAAWRARREGGSREVALAAFTATVVDAAR